MTTADNHGDLSRVHRAASARSSPANAQQKITPALKLLMMQPAPVVNGGQDARLSGGDDALLSSEGFLLWITTCGAAIVENRRCEYPC